MSPPVIALLTDFGRSDTFVGVMKGIILSRCPDARIVDLTHDIPPQDVRLGAFHLMVSAPFFPKGALFVCVIDPGVGSERRILWARNKDHQFLAPDNGLLSWINFKQAFEEIREVTNQSLMAGHISHTFHGRDIFAPVAAELAGGAEPWSLGAKAPALKELPFPRPVSMRGKVEGTVLAIDRFGNAVTNLTLKDVGSSGKFLFKNKKLGELKTHYAAVKQAQPLAVVGSFGYVELAVRDGSFARRFKAKVGDLVLIYHTREGGNRQSRHSREGGDPAKRIFPYNGPPLPRG